MVVVAWVVLVVSGVVLGESASLARILCLVLVVAGVVGLKVFH